MALTYTQLQDYINTNVKNNGNQAVTGAVMNYALIQLADWVYSNTALPDKAGNSLKFLRVNAAETGYEWATVSSGITIDSTAITSGTTRRVLFDNAGVVSETANFVFDASNQLVIGGHTGVARLDVKAGGSGSTDYWQRALNSSATINLFRGAGDGSFQYRLNDGQNLLQFGASGQWSMGYGSSMTNAVDTDVIIGKSTTVTAGHDSRVNIGANGKGDDDYGINLGANSWVKTGAAGGIAVGWSAQVSGTASSAYGMSMRSSGSYAIMMGGRYGGSADNNIDNSFMLHINGTSGGNYQHFK